MCKGCVDEQQLRADFDAAATVTWSTATEQHWPLAVLAKLPIGSTKLPCLSCDSASQAHKVCGRCSNLVCSLDCFRKHRRDVCAAACVMPPASIAEADTTRRVE